MEYDLLHRTVPFADLPTLVVQSFLALMIIVDLTLGKLWGNVDSLL